MDEKENKINDPYEKITDDSLWLYTYIFYEGLSKENQNIRDEHSKKEKTEESGTDINVDTKPDIQKLVKNKRTGKETEKEIPISPVGVS